jgi:acetolactate synthase-1/2/3 large subunit
MSDAVEAARHLVSGRGVPVIANGMGRGVIPSSDPRLVTRARSAAFREADLVLVVGAPLDFRLGYGVFGDPGAPVVHIVEHPDDAVPAATVEVAVVGDLSAALEHLADGPSVDDAWATRLHDAARAAVDADRADLESTSDPIHPARIYGELLPRLTSDAVVIGDGGDFVSFAGRYIEPDQPGRWLDPGPYGCLGTGPGFALAAGITHPGAPLFLLMGDGAAGFAMSDIDTLVRHRIPAVIVVGNNAGWALEKHPMRWLYGYDVIADLPSTHYDEIAIALGGGGETVSDPAQIGPALDRAMASGMPYLVNVLTDPEVAYPRSTLGI